jgi:hypothetical protein
MDEGHNFANLKAHVLGMSVSDHWESAKLEWELDHVEVLDVDEGAPPETCPCGHFPIVEMCWLRNNANGRFTFVGNVCVKRFFGLPVDAVADGFRRIIDDNEKALNAAATEFCFSQGWINKWERGFCLDTCRKRKLTGSQLNKRVQINGQVLVRLRDRGVERRRG